MNLANSRWTGLGVLALVLALLPLALPNNFYFDVANRIAINAIVAVGLNLLIGYAGQISMGHAGFFGLGGYVSAVLTANYGWPPLAALLVACVGVALLAYVVARPILRLKGHYLAMATLGLGMIVSIVITNESWLTGGPDGMVVPDFEVFGLRLYGEQTWYGVFAVLLVFAVWVALNIIDSPVGRALRAVHGSEVAAQVAGIDTTGYKVLVFVVSAVFATLVGSLSAHYGAFITPDKASFMHSVEFVTMVVVGGMASTFGAVVGAALLTLLPQVLSGLEDWEMVVFGLILMTSMIFMPRGLVPSLQARFTGGAR
ncbi:amino acid/amide ABC transporter membrane protein 2 (HAAT family) [Plasticicumulans lactativorans]|uniref:Amino acid/amide ABC transporter membrane protein 2 (HAAT family) n=1 Tax=Plasticicumulans lactativorans TaxID=1133106 RepID=A0A4R2L4P5_9GAMM|nr:branched-chain amino acid ABC transporter permease [Plasticicumulans lactativorans]TCO81443.1 amino acid/amide ABC transporter membrane protein 2 (HAAT family) [Plasticicumulans lactativorans]